ncbi:MAG: cytochrome-c peroxidase [Granulosicoccus sp.]
MRPDQPTIGQSAFARQVLLCLLLIGCMLSPARAALWPVVSASGRYAMVIDTQQAVALGAEQSWVIRARGASASFADIETIEIKGGMPAHRHGLPTEPTWEQMEPQGLRIETLRFHMPGQWFFELRFRDNQGWDSIRVNFNVNADGHLSMQSQYKKKAPSGHRHDNSLEWTAKEQAVIASLALAISPPPSTHDKQLISLGKMLFADKHLSGNGQISCNDCHQAEQYFTSDQLSHNHHSLEATDNHNQQAKRDVMSIVGVSDNPWLNWDGRKSELWSHALLPLEIEAELGNNRTRIAHTISRTYREEFIEILGEQAFSTQQQWPANAGPFGSETEKANWDSIPAKTRQQINAVFVSVGKALAAFQAQVQPAPGAFDRYANSLAKDGQFIEQQNNSHQNVISPSAQRGLRLFIGDKGRCINCHNNSHFTNHGFERVVSSSPIDFGRTLGAQLYLYDEFNCRSGFSASSDALCDETINQAKKHAAHSPQGAFKVPGLRGLEKTAPYMHDGRFPDLPSVIAHYNSVGNRFGQGDLLPGPGSLSAQDQLDLVEFLLSLGSDYIE